MHPKNVCLPGLLPDLVHQLCICQKTEQPLVSCTDNILHSFSGLDTVLVRQLNVLFHFCTLICQIQRSTLSCCCYHAGLSSWFVLSMCGACMRLQGGYGSVGGQIANMALTHFDKFSNRCPHPLSVSVPVYPHY